MPALSSTAASALACSSAENTGERTRRVQVRARRDQRVERLQISLDLVDGVALERQLEQRGRITPRHAGNDAAFACHAEPARLFL